MNFSSVKNSNFGDRPICMFIWFQVLRILLKYTIYFQNTYSQSNKYSHTHIQTNAITQTLSINDIYIQIYSLHLHEIVEGLYFHCSLSVCEWVSLSVSEQNSNRTEASIWTRFSLNGCLQYWLKPYWNWWPWVKGQGHGDRKCM